MRRLAQIHGGGEWYAAGPGDNIVLYSTHFSCSSKPGAYITHHATWLPRAFSGVKLVAANVASSRLEGRATGVWWAQFV